MVFVLVIFMKVGYSGGAVSIQYPTEAQCEYAMAVARKALSYQDAFCIPGPDIFK